MLEKLLNKYCKMNKQLKVVFWFTFVGFLQKGISLITTPIFTRVLSTEDYGLFSVFNAYYTVLVIIVTLNLHMGVINNAFVKLQDSNEKIVSAFQSISFTLSAVFFVLAIIFKEQLANIMGLPTIIVIFMFLGFMFKEPYHEWVIYKRYEFEYIKPVIFSVVFSVLTPLLSILAIFLAPGNQGEARIISYVVVNTIIPGTIFYVINYKKGKVFYDKALWSYAISFNVPLIAHYLSETLLNQTDRIMINAFLGTSEAGIYSVAFSAANLVMIFASSMNTAFVPWTYQKLKESDTKNLEKISYIILILLAGILSLMIMFAPEVVAILAGDKYTGAVYLIPALAASVYFNFMYTLFGRVELYYDKKSYTAIGTITAAVVNIILNAWWIPQFGYQAAGYSTLLSHILLCVMHFFFLRKVNRECMFGKKVYDGKIILVISGAVLGIAFLMILLYDFFILRMIILFIVIVAFIINRKRFVAIYNMVRKK